MGTPNCRDLAVHGVLELHHHVARLHLGIAHHLLGLVDLAHAHVGLDEVVPPLVPRAGAEDGLDLLPGLDLLRVGGAHELVGLAREAGEVGAVDRLAEVLPQPGLGAADGQQLAVARLVDRVVRVGAAEEARAPRLGASPSLQKKRMLGVAARRATEVSR